MKDYYKLSVIFLFLLILGCSTPGHRYLSINAPSFAAVMVPEQLNTFLNKNGFYRTEFSTRVIDTNSNPDNSLNKKTGMVLTQQNRLLMRYQHESIPDFMIDTNINRDTGKINLDFYEQGQTGLSAEALRIYNQLKDNLSARLYDKNDFKER